MAYDTGVVTVAVAVVVVVTITGRRRQWRQQLWWHCGGLGRLWWRWRWWWRWQWRVEVAVVVAVVVAVAVAVARVAPPFLCSPASVLLPIPLFESSN